MAPKLKAGEAPLYYDALPEVPTTPDRTSIRAQAFRLILDRKDVITLDTQIAQAARLAQWLETGQADD